MVACMGSWSKDPSRHDNHIGSAAQEILRLLCNPKIHDHVHNSLVFDPILNQINPAHTLPTYLFKITF
jgi:hypothetical protein